MANGYTYTKCYYTGRKIWTKDVWRCAILRTIVLSHQISSHLPPKSPKTPFWGTFQCENYYTESPPSVARFWSYDAYTVRLYRYKQVLGVCQNFSARGIWGEQGPLMWIWDPRIISETTGARKLNLQIPLDMVKYPHWVQKLLYYTTQHGDGRHIDFRQMSVSEADYG